uniref:BTB/POZ domain-containing protein 9 n=1 Tax=Cacopsylla melanoneura TaxID=428564 RepID=A0A8D8M3U0_9HEMI
MSRNTEDFLYNGSLFILGGNMELLFNNPEYSDTTFIIRDAVLYAWSGLVSVASTTLGSLISTQFKNCDNREINLRSVKNVESFSIVLKSIYGLTINFTQTNIAVLCEALTLADDFKLTKFFVDLKSYLSDVDNFSVETAVVLLNTAYKFKMTNLYDRVTIFAYHNSDHLMKHESFPDLQYSVLVNLLKSNWFCSPEIDILTGILYWHTDMDRESKNVKYLAKENAEDVTENHNMSDLAELSDSETNEAEKTDNVSNDKNVECLPDGKESPNTASNSKNAEPAPSKKTDKGMDIVPVFAKNVLKSLLALVRISRISAKEWMEALLTELFKNYNHLLLDVHNFSSCHLARQEYVIVTFGPEYTEYLVRNVKRTFTIKGIHRTHTQLYESEIYFLSNLHTRIGMKFTDWRFGKNDKTNFNIVFTMFLKCSSDKPESWESITECQLKLISNTIDVNNIVLPADHSYTTLILNDDEVNSCIQYVKIGEWEWEGPRSDWFKTYKPNDIYTFEVDFKSIHTKIPK